MNYECADLTKLVIDFESTSHCRSGLVYLTFLFDRCNTVINILNSTNSYQLNHKKTLEINQFCGRLKAVYYTELPQRVNGPVLGPLPIFTTLNAKPMARSELKRANVIPGVYNVN